MLHLKQYLRPAGTETGGTFRARIWAFSERGPAPGHPVRTGGRRAVERLCCGRSDAVAIEAEALPPVAGANRARGISLWRRRAKQGGPMGLCWDAEGRRRLPTRDAWVHTRSRSGGDRTHVGDVVVVPPPKVGVISEGLSPALFARMR